MTTVQNDKIQNDISSRRDDITTKWHYYKMTLLQDDITTRWHYYKMAFLQNDNTSKLLYFEMKLVLNNQMTLVWNSISMKWE